MAMTRTCSGKLGRHGCWDCFLFGGMLRKKNSEVWLLNPWELWILGGCGDLGTDDSTFWFVPVVFLVVVELKMDQNASICCTGMYWEFGYWIAMDWLEQENVPRHSQLFFLHSCLNVGWWFGTFFIFPYIGNNHSNWLIFFRGIEPTNQITLVDIPEICFDGATLLFGVGQHYGPNPWLCSSFFSGIAAGFGVGELKYPPGWWWWRTRKTVNMVL